MGEQSPSPSNASVQEELGESGAQEEGGGGLLDFLLGGGSGVGGAPAAPPGDADGGPPASPGAPGAPGAYVVQAGDTVGNIAERGTGDRGKYVELNAHNLRAPNDGDLEPGDVLRIPPGWDLAALQTSGSQAPGSASAEEGFDPIAVLPPLIQVQVLLGQDGDADKDELAELWAQMNEGEQQALLSMGPLAEEARRVLELPADAPADAGFMQGVLDVASGLASEGAEVLDSAQSGAKEWWNGSAQEQAIEAPGESAEQLPEFFRDPGAPLGEGYAASRSSFVGDALVEACNTTEILDQVWRYFGDSDEAWGALMNDSELVWKVNFHHAMLGKAVEYVLEMQEGLDEESEARLTEEELGIIYAIPAALESVAPPTPIEDLQEAPGTTKDTSTGAELKARHSVIMAHKRSLQAVLHRSGLHLGHKLQKAVLLGTAPVAMPDDSMHSSGKAIDIKGDNAGIGRMATLLGAEVVFPEGSHVHTEWPTAIDTSAADADVLKKREST